MIKECYHCKGYCGNDTDWTQEDEDKEFKELYGEYPNDYNGEVVSLCDTCYYEVLRLKGVR